MNKVLLVILLITLTGTAFAQQDSIIKKIPVVNGRIVYADSITITGHTAAELDSAAKKWLRSYFLYTDTNVSHANALAGGILFNRGVFEFKCRPGYLNIPFYGIITIQVFCRDNFYSYRITDIFFRPHNGVLNAIGYERDPNFLMSLYNKKHLSFSEAWRVDKHEIRGYLVGIDAAVRSCIASLNKAMAN